MPARRKIPEDIQKQVRQRAIYLCEYCHASEQWQYVAFTIDHVIPLTTSGADIATDRRLRTTSDSQSMLRLMPTCRNSFGDCYTIDNLALACFHCNRKKSGKTTAIDPHSSTQVPLFNPRQHSWSEHFIWSADGLSIIGLTSIGRATVTALALNRERVINIRAADKTVGRHPPAGDPIQPEN